MFEGGHRVPFIASWPGVIPAGKTNNEALMTKDFLPTFAELADASIPDGHLLDGMDIMPLLQDDTKKSDRVLHWMHADAWAVRKGSWKLTGQGGNAQTLVNLDKDLSEKDNLIRENAETADELINLHRQWIADVGNR